jgi:heme/copper-type cytochrome/quinol oxidase subunit 3
VTDTFERMQAKAAEAKQAAKSAADQARSASAKAALWIFVSLLVGAFFASFLATLGGRHRDQF